MWHKASVPLIRIQDSDLNQLLASARSHGQGDGGYQHRKLSVMGSTGCTGTTGTEKNMRYRLAFLGGPRVGKTAIIRRYLNDSFTTRYKETVDDIYSRDFKIKGETLPLDIHDTNYKKTDMRALETLTANSFVVVFDMTNAESFEQAKSILMDVFQKRSDFSDIPSVLAGNKDDLDEPKIDEQDVHDYLEELNIAGSCRFLRVSAKEKTNISLIFKTLTDISGFPYRQLGGGPSALNGPASSRLLQNFNRRSLRKRLGGPQKQAEPVANGQTDEDGTGGLVRQTKRLSLKLTEFALGDEEEKSECTVS